jgi:sarcosine oxidase, subunit beta
VFADDENRMTLLSMDPLATSDRDSKAAADHYRDVVAVVDGRPASTLAGARVAVVGGGVIGLMSALYLSRAGASVHLFEAQSLGAAASGRNAGGIYAFGRAIEEVALARLSMQLWEQLQADGVHAQFHRAGHAIAARNDRELELLKTAQRHYELAELPVTMLSPCETSKLLPGISPENAGALMGTTDAQGYPFTAVASLLSMLHANGASIHDHCPVDAVVERNGRAVGVHSSLGVTEADHVLLCTGPWTNRFVEAEPRVSSVRPRRSQLMVTERVPGIDPFPFVSGNGFYARRTHAGNLLIGGGGPWEENGYNVTSSSHAMSFLGARMTELFPGLAGVPVIRAFAGTVELTPDHLPLLGAAPSMENLWISAGYNGHGFGLSAAAGRLVVELLQARHNDTQVPEAIAPLVRDLKPARFASNGSSDV